MMRFGFPVSLTVGLSLGLLVSSCGDSGGSGDGDKVCDPGETQECVCSDGMGAQECAEDGASWEDCQCGGDTGSGADASDDGTGADDGETGADDGGTSGDDGASGGTTGDTGGDGGTQGGTGGTSFVTLQNDQFVDMGPANAQAGFVENECWGSTYVPGPGHYPFTIHSVQVLVGPGDMGNFEVSIYDVDSSNKPTTKVDGVDVSMQGSTEAFNEINFATVGLSSPTYTQGNFAIVVCLRYTTIPMMANPTIFSDVGGQMSPDRNWLYDTSGTWSQSSAFFVSGDWIMRAIIEVQ